ncbi:tyrosine-protein kinase receptor-like [Saccostrea echinata]|uniref:tyrosine-protein kinase receptor-like n=1 Tax=Saccostrea echinata TaxID=191078 RepID=UPI002A81E81B|nr:tyrosine-protein kinase receptor-like [Saccostrea echinata]
MPVTSNENNCTVAFNVTALANRRKITVILHMISKDRSKSQMDILKRDGRQQTLTFSFPFLDDKLLQYYLRAVIWLDIELFDEILFAGVSMSPGCFRVSLTKETTTNEVKKESTSTKLQRNITEKFVTGDLSKLMNKSAKVSLTKGTTINEVRKESTSTELQRNITEKLVTGDLSKLMNKSAKGNPNEDTSGRNSNKVTVGDIVLIIVTVALVSALIFGTTFKFLRYHKNKTVEVKTSAVCDVISGTGFIEDNICNSNPNYSWYRSSWITGRINNFHFKDLKMFEEIGNGHFGLVRRGKILSTSTPVALKELKPCSTAVEKMDFLLEAITLCKLKHSNIVRCFGISTSQQHICILLELMDGDLKNYLRKNRDLGVSMATVFSLTHSLKLAIDVCRACVYLEAIKFIHRDIAARNCLILNKEGQVVVKIADFGMARDVTMTQYYVKEGTCKVPVRWMSPESMLNGRFSSKTDIWAFGVLMWEIYTGARLPYGDFTIDAVMSHIIQGGKLDKPAKCSDDVWQIMQMCWLDCADERPSFRDLEKSLQTCLNTGDEQESEGNTEDTILL